MKNILTIIIILISIKGYGQTELDTIRFQNVKTKTINSIESLGMKIIDTLKRPKGFILWKKNNPEIIAIKKGSKYLIFDLLPDSDYGYVTDTDRIQVNGKNHKELVVYCDDVIGHSGLGGGLREVHRRIIIYDLKQVTKLFDKEYFFSTYSWDNEVSDSLTVASTTESFECYNHQTEISNKKIIFELKENEECNEMNLSDFITTKWIYKLHKNIFIGKAY